MTDPVDTDALRARADDDDALGYPEAAELLRDVADEVNRLREANEEAESARSAAAAYGDRLRAVIENAPHPIECKRGNSGNTRVPCTCWKADAL